MPELVRCTPYFEVFDMEASVDFYTRLLGFEVVFASPEVHTNEGRFSHFVRLARGRAELMLNTAYDANERPAGRTEPRWGATRHYQLYFDCDDVLALYAELQDRGLAAPEPKNTGYGFVGFSVTDPDGHLLVFHQPL